MTAGMKGDRMFQVVEVKQDVKPMKQGKRGKKEGSRPQQEPVNINGSKQREKAQKAVNLTHEKVHGKVMSTLRHDDAYVVFDRL